jgi:tetratricopeptide (TPR) repeat protein
MDAKNLQRALEKVVSLVRDIRDQRGHRLHGKDAADLREDLNGINQQIAATGNGLLLRQKREWFKYDQLLLELGELKLIMETLQACLDADVRQELLQERQPLEKIEQHLENSLDWINVFRGAIESHQRMVDDALAGKTVSSQELVSLENRLLRFNDWEEQILSQSESALARVMPYARELKTQTRTTLSRIAATMILPLAAAAAMMFSGTAYAQDVAKGEKQTFTVNDQISILEGKLDKTSDEYLKLAELYSKSNNLEKATSTINDYLKNNPNDIRALVQKRDLDGKKGISYKHPDEDLQNILNVIDVNKYRALLGEQKYKEIIDDLEPTLAKTFAYNLNELNKNQKSALQTIMNSLANAYYGVNRKDDRSFAAATLAIELVPESPLSYSIRGAVLWEHKRFDDAINEYQKTIKYAPNIPLGYAGVAQCEYDKGEYQAALKSFEIALEKAPQEKKARYQQRIDACKAKLGLQ